MAVPGQTKAKIIQNSKNIFSSILAPFNEIMRSHCFILQLFSHKLKEYLSVCFVDNQCFYTLLFRRQRVSAHLFSFALEMQFQKNASNEDLTNSFFPFFLFNSSRSNIDSFKATIPLVLQDIVFPISFVGSR